MREQAITFYHADTGRIEGAIWGTPEQIELNRQTAELPFVEGSYSADTHYVDGGFPTPRPVIPAKWTGSALVNLPTPCTIYIGEAVYPCSDSTAELEFEHPGTYTVRVEAWPYLDKEFQIENPAR